MEKLRRLVPVLTFVAVAVGIYLLLPLALAMPAISTPLFPLATSLYFLVMLGGPLLMFASGLRQVITGISRKWFLAAFAALLVAAGGGLFERFLREEILFDWLAMSLLITLVAALLRRNWLWGVVGGVWTGSVLAALCVAGALKSLSSATLLTELTFSFGCVLAFTNGVVAFMCRSQECEKPI